MRAQSVEPMLSWPTSGRRDARPIRIPDEEAGWSSKRVPAAEEPLARVAALLLAISQNNGYEGRDPKIMPESLTSGFVADLLGVDIATLAALLVDLRRRGLVDCGSNSTLVLRDLSALERIVS